MRLEADRVGFAYRNAAPCLREVSLVVESGEIVFVLGANGSGKSTLLGCLAATRRPTSGAVLLNGSSLLGLRPRDRAREIGVVPQFGEPAFALNVEEAVLLGRASYVGLFAQPGPEDRSAVSRALDEVGLSHLRRRPIQCLSGGERQLVWIARGLAQGARFLLLDEPTAHLDPAHERELFSVVRRLAAAGSAFFVASHDPGSALLYAHRVTLLRGGEVAASGPPGDTLSAETLFGVYGVEFAVIAGPNGERALIPHIRDAAPAS